MARDRQRAKRRKARRAAQNPGPAPSEPHRANVPGELDHASGEADEFDAAIVAGAGGTPADDDDAVEDAERVDEGGRAAGDVAALEPEIVPVPASRDRRDEDDDLFDEDDEEDAELE